MTAPERTGSRTGLPIAGVSELLGIPVPTIRSWERRYGVPAPPRTRGRHRRYSEQEISQLRDLRDLVTKGYSTADAARRIGRTEHDQEGGEAVDEVVRSALSLDAGTMQETLERASRRLGVEEAIVAVALPAMRVIGARWKAGTCNVDHEHLATQVVRSWLTRKTPPEPPTRGRDPIVLACGPKDMHTIALEAFGVLLARRGRSVRLLGALTPTDALASTVRSLRAPAAVLACQRGVTRKAAIGSIEAVASIAGTRAFYAGEGFASPAARTSVPGQYLGEDLLAAADTVEAVLGRRGSTAPDRARR
jgi:MerR family transcriptional regulator, light-induced transcriptional regulator